MNMLRNWWGRVWGLSDLQTPQQKSTGEEITPFRPSRDHLDRWAKANGWTRPPDEISAVHGVSVAALAILRDKRSDKMSFAEALAAVDLIRGDLSFVATLERYWRGRAEQAEAQLDEARRKSAHTYSEVDRLRALGVMVQGNRNGHSWGEIVDLMAEALGMRRAGA